AGGGGAKTALHCARGEIAFVAHRDSQSLEINHGCVGVPAGGGGSVCSRSTCALIGCSSVLFGFGLAQLVAFFLNSRHLIGWHILAADHVGVLCHGKTGQGHCGNEGGDRQNRSHIHSISSFGKPVCLAPFKRGFCLPVAFWEKPSA